MVCITYHRQFLKDVKRLAKKYKSLPDDLYKLVSDIKENPILVYILAMV